MFILGLTFLIISLGFVFISASSMVHTGLYAVELFSHFQVQSFFLGLIFLLIAMAIPFKYKVSVCALMIVALAINLVNILPYFFPHHLKPAPDDAQIYTVLQANVFKFNFETDPLLNLINQENPDIIALSEVTPKWDAALSPLKGEYPHHLIVTEDGSHGMAIFSKLPFEDSSVKQISEFDMPSFFIDFETFKLITIHPLPPVFQSFYRSRNQHFEWLETYLEKEKQTPVALAGDMNSTMFAPRFKIFTKRAGLQNARRGRGIQNTWFAFDLHFLGIPIDHFLYNDKIAVQSSQVTQTIKSDHLPILTKFYIKDNNNEKQRSQKPSQGRESPAGLSQGR